MSSFISKVLIISQPATSRFDMAITPRIRGSLAMAVQCVLVLVSLALMPPAMAADNAAAGDENPVATVDLHYSLLVPAAEIASGPGGWNYTNSQCIALFGKACYTPALMRAAYNVPTDADGSGQTIVIVDAYGSPTVREDLNVFCTTFGLPSADLEVLFPFGAPHWPSDRQGNSLDQQHISWAGETTLDVQWAHAIAPKAKIVLVVSPSPLASDLDLAQRYAVDHRLGQVMSLSFGYTEPGVYYGGHVPQWFGLVTQQAHSIYEDAVAAGITVFAVSHDYGATLPVSGSPIVAFYPASDPLVTAVGGTSLFMTDSGQYLGETVWNDFDNCPLGCRYGPFPFATGGAPSVLFNAPSYQSALSGFTARTTSDVSYNAGCYTAVVFYLGFLGANSGFYSGCGTSAGAPQWGAITELVNQARGVPVGFLNPRLYAMGADPAQYAQLFHDVTIGDNIVYGGGFYASPGYDLPTGLGSPDVAALIDKLKTP